MANNQDNAADAVKTIELTGWEAAKIRTLLRLPAAAVYGEPENYERMATLIRKIDGILGSLVEEGYMQPAGKPMTKAAQGPAAPRKSKNKRG